MSFEGYHPTINLIYFVTAIAFMCWFNHPVFVAIGYVCAFMYSVKLNGLKQLIFDFCLIPFGAAYAAWYMYYNHFGVTNLATNIVGNQITLESLLFSIVLSVKILSVIMMLSCMFKIFTADKVVYLFGRVSPKLSLFLSIILRTVPRVKNEAKAINTAQKGVGKGTNQGNVFQRIGHFFRECSMLITWMLESFMESSHSMKSRGYTLKGRTAFSIYRFDNRDRSFVIALAACIVCVLVGVALNQAIIFYDPVIIMNRITPLSFVFYCAYIVLLLLPMALQVVGEWNFKRLRNV